MTIVIVTAYSFHPLRWSPNCGHSPSLRLYRQYVYDINTSDLGCHLGSNQPISNTRSTSQHLQPKRSMFEKLDFRLILALTESLI